MARTKTDHGRNRQTARAARNTARLRRIPPLLGKRVGASVNTIVPKLLDWFSTNARDLPWRRTHDPYAIWVSEIMLQQTQVKTVIPHWQRWMRELPTIQFAAKALPAKLHKLWEGLGYYTRVRNLQKAAQRIVVEHNGKFPDNFDDILALSGIGRYTAGAIASIAFNQPRPILDGNVIRVLSRIFGITTNACEKKTNAQLWQIAEELVGEAARINSSHSSRRKEALTDRLLAIDRRLSKQSLLTSAATNETACSHLNQSIMELGALICTPRSPRCDACPVNNLCIARKRNLQEQLPNVGKRKSATARCFIAFIVERDGNFLVRQRPDGVVNAHLWEFPNVEIGASDGRARHSVRAATRLSGNGPQRTDAPCHAENFRLTSAKPLCTIKHSITRYRITLEAYRAELATARLKLHGRWLTLPQVHKLAFASAHRKILAELEKRR